MMERLEDKFRAIGDLERFNWNGLLNTYQVHNSFVYQGALRFSWNNENMVEQED